MTDSLAQYFLQRMPPLDNATLGEWRNDQGAHLCYTIELPWRDNHPRVSCIPVGTYIFDAYESPKHGQVWMARNVPGRSAIEVHNANLARQLEGCIGVGATIGTLDGEPAVLHSVDTLEMLRLKLPSSFQLTIN